MTPTQGSPAPTDWPKTGEEIGLLGFGPFEREQLVRYAAVSSDDNPLHLDERIAAAAGLEAPPVHGMLMLSCFESALMGWRRDIFVSRLSAKFLRPVLAGQGISISGRVVRSNLAPRPELVLRLAARGPDRELAIMAEATLLHHVSGPSS
ncbi:MaoC/PaaZ C-terminal domain-containing protein [Methylocapsa polymorpha]|uniref:MaoC/PaaZ C-terminal domain-containing protein n=1 Tax=Methylocapsa polymorpha TaxID=3080828 RepID=A0ABZ0HNQ6_9HYPH|nr:MaoC/PaaZ C-terminal domain-containing protein [Methylocapsa sp. RX1]